MNNRYRIKNPDTMIRIGLACLVISGLLSLRFVHATAHFGQDAIDGAAGLLMGIAIVFMLFGVWMKGRGRRQAGGTPCA